MRRIKYKDGEPCKHKGCLSHLSHPCEGCGRVGGQGIVYEDDINTKVDFSVMKGAAKDE